MTCLALGVPACRHWLCAYPLSRTLQILRVGRVLSAWPSSPPQSAYCQQEGPAVLQRLRDRRSTLQGGPEIATPATVMLRTSICAPSRMFCLWRYVQCRGLGCSLGQLSFRSRRRQHNRRGHTRNTHYSLQLTSGTGLSLSLIIHVLRNSTRSLCRRVSCQRYLYSTFRSIDRMSSPSLSNLTASQMCRSNEDNRPSIHRPPRHNHHGRPR